MPDIWGSRCQYNGVGNVDQASAVLAELLQPVVLEIVGCLYAGWAVTNEVRGRHPARHDSGHGVQALAGAVEHGLPHLRHPGGRQKRGIPREQGRLADEYVFVPEWVVQRIQVLLEVGQTGWKLNRGDDVFGAEDHFRRYAVAGVADVATEAGDDAVEQLVGAGSRKQHDL